MEIQPEQVYAQLGSITFGMVDEFGVDWSLELLEGWTDSGSTLEAVRKPRAHGAWAGDAFRPERHVAMGGQIHAPSGLALSDAIDRLNSACTLDDNTLTVFEAGRSRWATVRRSSDVIVRYVMPTIATWSVQVVAVDPRKFGTELSGSTFLPASSGGTTFPMTFPFTIDAMSISGQVSLTNPGNETGPVWLRIDGPTTGPVITHVGSGLALTFSSSLVLQLGEWLDIDMEKHTVLANGQASRNRYVTSRGWSGFEPNDNTWQFTAASFDAASKLTVRAVPSWE